MVRNQLLVASCGDTLIVRNSVVVVWVGQCGDVFGFAVCVRAVHAVPVVPCPLGCVTLQVREKKS